MDYKPTDVIFLPRQGLKVVLGTFTEVFYEKAITLYSLRGRDGSTARVSARSLTLLRARPLCTAQEMSTAMTSLSTPPPTTRESWTARDRNITEQLNRGAVTDHSSIIRLLYRLDGTHWAYSRFLHYDTAVQFLAEEFAHLHSGTHAEAVAHIRNCAKRSHSIPA